MQQHEGEQAEPGDALRRIGQAQAQVAQPVAPGDLARLRPSPLNLIYRSFSERVARLDPARIQFTFLDFDAY